MYKVKIFHHNDADGYTSAYLVSKALKNVKYDSIDFYEMDYNTEFPLEEIDESTQVYIVDYSIKPEDMLRLLRKTIDVIWIDHHISAINKYDDWMDLIERGSGISEIPGIRVNGLSASALCYLYFFEGYTENALQELRDVSKSEDEVLKVMTEDFNSRAPEWLYLVDNWDVWKLDTPKAEQLQISIANQLSIDLIRSIDLNPKLLEYFLEKGKDYIEYRDIWSVGFMKKYGFETILEDTGGNFRKVFVANLGNANSKFFGDLINEYDAVITMCFNGDFWNYSIYSNKDYFDCSKVAMFFGGGGHKGAAGFILQYPFTKETIFTKSTRGGDKTDGKN